MLVVPVRPGVVQVPVGDTVAVLAKQRRLPGAVHPGGVGVAGVETHRGVGRVQQGREVGHVEEVPLRFATQTVTPRSVPYAWSPRTEG